MDRLANTTFELLRFKHIFWVDATDSVTAEQHYKEIGICEAFPTEKPKNISSLRVLNWISKLDEEWLLVLDNCPGEDFRMWLPRGHRGNILYTSQFQVLRFSIPKDCIVRIGAMELKDAKTLLAFASGRVPYPPEWEVIETIAEELGRLPLALDQAGAYIDTEESCSFQEYLELFRKQRNFLMRQDKLEEDDSRLSVYATFDISYHAIQRMARNEKRPDEGENARNALKILELLCFYHNDAFPTEMILRAAENRARKNRRKDFPLDEGPSSIEDLLETDESGFWLRLRFNMGLSLLKKISLVRLDKTSKYTTMHVLIHNWARDRMDKEVGVNRALLAKSVLCDSITYKGSTPDILYRQLLIPHVMACFRHAKVEHPSELLESEYDEKFGFLALEAGMFKEAEVAYKKVINVRKWEFDLDSEAGLVPKSRLAQVYFKGGQYTEAEELYLEIIDRRVGARGETDSKTLSSRCGLLTVYAHQGAWPAAERELKMILKALLEKQAGKDPNHRMIRQVLDGLRYTHQVVSGSKWIRSQEEKQESVMEFVSLMDQSSSITREEREQQLARATDEHGRTHPRTMTARAALARALQREERLSEAELLIQENCDYSKEMYGDDDLRTIDERANMAHHFLIQGRSIELESVARSMLWATQAKLGPYHHKTLDWLHNLSLSLMDQSRLPEAITLFRLCGDARASRAGSEHHFVLFDRHVAKVLENSNLEFTPDIQRKSRAKAVERHRKARVAIGAPVLLTEKDEEPYSIDYRSLAKEGSYNRESFPEMIYVDTEEGLRVYDEVIQSLSESRGGLLEMAMTESTGDGGGTE
jgi:hypothetical protein